MVEITKTLTNRGTLRIAEILRHGPARPGAIARALAERGAARRMIDADLVRMARDGLIIKELTKIAAPARPVYSLSPLGQEFAALASPLLAWTDAHQSDIEAARQRARDAKENQRADALLAERAA